MTDQSASLAQSKYRRGTILGLTVAEIFILLLFLLMLAFLVLSQEQTQRLERQEQELEQLQTFRETWEEPLAGIETPEEIVALKRLRDSVAANAGESGNERLLDQLVEVERERIEAEAARQELEKENEQLLAERAEQQEQLEDQQEQLEDLQQRNEEYEEIAEQQRIQQEKLDEQQEQLEDLQQRNEEYEEIVERQRILREKGQNPPCWYEIVPAANGGTREKAFYLFDIAVFDAHMIVRGRPPPPGGAFDDGGGPYAEEAASLPLEGIRYETPLADDEVVELLSPIFNAGKESSVRTYSCVFFVQVWDETSEFAKERWQQAHDRVLEGLFGTFTVRDEPWRLR